MQKARGASNLGAQTASEKKREAHLSCTGENAARATQNQYNRQRASLIGYPGDDVIAGLAS